MRFVLADIVHVTWGLPTSIAGAVVCAACGPRRERFRFRSALVTEWGLRAGLSLGPFIFVPSHYPRPLLVHEYGHSIQALMLGPLYLPTIVLPSLVWAGLPAMERRRTRRHTSYYAFFPERWANALGERVCHERSMR